MATHDDKSKTSKAARGNSSTRFQRTILERTGQDRDDDWGRTLRSRMAKEEMKQMFRRYKGPVGGTAEEDLKQEMGTFFSRHFDKPEIRSRGDFTDKDKRIKERIAALQKRTTETLEVVNQCMEAIEAVPIIQTKPEISDDGISGDKRSLHELTEELWKMQNGKPSKNLSATPLNRPDMDDITRVNSKLLEDLRRISKRYGTLK